MELKQNLDVNQLLQRELMEHMSDDEPGTNYFGAVASDEGVPIAFVFGKPDDDDSAQAFIKLLYVIETYRRRGIGRQLLKMFETIAVQNLHDQLVLVVNDSNGPAKVLYEQHGFEKVADASNGYSLMIKDLEE